MERGTVGTYGLDCNISGRVSDEVKEEVKFKVRIEGQVEAVRQASD